MKIGAIIQARWSAQRLPGKVLKELPFQGGVTVVEQVIRRLKRSDKLNEIIVATTVHPEDDALVQTVKKEQVKCFRGSKEDVLSRYVGAAQENKLDLVVRITSDCPCIDAAIVDEVIAQHIGAKADYTSNALKRSYPHGLDAEVFSAETLAQIAREAKDLTDREHVTSYIYRNPQKFKIKIVEAPVHLRDPEIRITLDTEQDYILLCAIYDALYPADQYFSAEAVVNLVRQKPWLKLVNQNVVQKKIFTNLDEELKAALDLLNRQDLKRAEEWVRNQLSVKL